MVKDHTITRLHMYNVVAVGRYAGVPFHITNFHSVPLYLLEPVSQVLLCIYLI